MRVFHVFRHISYISANQRHDQMNQGGAFRPHRRNLTSVIQWFDIESNGVLKRSWCCEQSLSMDVSAVFFFYDITYNPCIDHLDTWTHGTSSTVVFLLCICFLQGIDVKCSYLDVYSMALLIRNNMYVHFWIDLNCFGVICVIIVNIIDYSSLEFRFFFQMIKNKSNDLLS